jgi:hypothetical protein
MWVKIGRPGKFTGGFGLLLNSLLGISNVWDLKKKKFPQIFIKILLKFWKKKKKSFGIIFGIRFFLDLK